MTDSSDKEPALLGEPTRNKLRAAFSYLTDQLDGGFGGVHFDVPDEEVVALNAREVGVAYDREASAWLCTVIRPEQQLDEHSVTDIYVLPDNPDEPVRVERVIQRYDEDDLGMITDYSRLQLEWKNSLIQLVLIEGMDMMERDFARMEAWAQGYQDFLERTQRAAELRALAMTEAEWEEAETTTSLLEVEAEFDDPLGEEDVPRDNTPLGRHMQLVDELLKHMTGYLEIQRQAELIRSVHLIEVIVKGNGKPFSEPAAFDLMRLVAKIVPR